MALTYRQLQDFTGNQYKAPEGVNLDAPSVWSGPVKVTPAQRDYLFNYVGQRFNMTPQQVEAAAMNVPSLALEQNQPYAPQVQTVPMAPTGDYGQMFANAQAQTSAEIERATAPLFQTIKGLEDQLKFNAQNFQQSEEARRTSIINAARGIGGVTNAMQIQPASRSTSSDSFKIRGSRRGVSGANPNEVIPSAVNI